MVHLLIIIIYLAFISLGLPDAVLGSAWPIMYVELGVPLSYSGIISMIISASTICSSLLADKLIRRLGTGIVTAVSVVITALALLAFSFSNEFWILCIAAIPYGLGAGCIDTALNNFVALHYSSKHMNWLHCMWGVGAIIGPTIMGAILTNGQTWNTGYRALSTIQIALSLILFLSIPLWKKKSGITDNNGLLEDKSSKSRGLSLIQIFKIPGAKQVFITFFCYCALESIAMLWASSYLVLHNGVGKEMAAILGSMFFIGMTVGRAISGFVSIKLSDTQIIKIGEGITLLGCILLFIPAGEIMSIISIVVLGLGCAPIYPSIIHSTPTLFGKENSQALIGVQMAFAYVGSCFMPPLFGVVADKVSISLLPVFLIIFTVLMIVLHEWLVKKTSKARILVKQSNDNCSISNENNSENE